MTRALPSTTTLACPLLLTAGVHADRVAAPQLPAHQ